MHITAASLSLGSDQVTVSLEERRMRLAIWTGAQPGAAAQEQGQEQEQDGSVASAATVLEGLSSYARRLQAAPAAPASSGLQGQDSGSGGLGASGTTSGDARTDALALLLEKLFGVKPMARLDLGGKVDSVSVAQAPSQAPPAPNPAGSAGWGLSYDQRDTSAEAEVLAVHAQGDVSTADGRRIAVSLDYRRQRSEVVQDTLGVRAGDAAVQDPLMLDLGGQGGGFSAASAPVDLAEDGRTESLPLPAAGSWYLIRSRQVPTVGSDFFGPATGQGFQELAALDADGNGFIDAADPAFSGLALWNGQSDPVPLAAAGIGAVGTSAVAAPFQYTDAAGTLRGLNRASGIYLTEDGRAGAVNQVDVVA